MVAMPSRLGTKAGLFGTNLLRLRNKAGWTQEVLAEKAGLARATIARLETGKHEGPEAKTVAAICGALGCSEADLYRSDAPVLFVAPALSMTAEQFLARHREVTRHEQEIIVGYGRTRPGAVERWTEEDWLALVRVIRAEFPPELG